MGLNMKPFAMANLILDHLNEYGNRHNPMYTEAIMRTIFDNAGVRNTASTRSKPRRILERLHAAGHVVRTGDSTKHKYMISPSATADGWDRNFPFNGSGSVSSAPTDEVVDDSDDNDDNDLPVPAPSVPVFANPVEIERLKERVRELEDKNRNLSEVVHNHSKELEEKESRIDMIEKLAASTSKTIKIEEYTGKIRTLKDVVLPSYFQDLVDLARCRRNILLIGPAGCGKTTVAELLAKTLGLAFGKVGGSGGLSENHLLGKSIPNFRTGIDHYRASEFVTRYEKGGLMLVDELDAADQNVLLALNPALDRSGMLPINARVDNPIAKKHKDFVCVATANTFGRGPDKIYAGRNQLDGATLDRYTIGTIECGYESAIERFVCPSKGENDYTRKDRGAEDDSAFDRIEAKGYGLRGTMEMIRDRMEECTIRRIMSTRFMEDAWVMHESAKWSVKKILKQYFAGWTRDERSKVLSA